MKRHLKWIIPVAVVAVVLLVFLGQRGQQVDAEASPEGEAAAEENLPDRSARCEVGEIDVKLNEVGEIQPETMVLVKSKVSGKVTALHVEEGQSVRKGDLLVSIEPDMAQARTVANLKSGFGRAKVNHERARIDYERDLELHKADLISDEELRLAKDDYDITRIEYRSALEEMRLAEEDGVSMDLDAETAEILHVLAPGSGAVILVEIEEGEIVTSGALSYTSGTTLMTIADLSVMQIKAGINEVDVGKIRNGQDVTIDVDAYPNAKFHGLISHVAPAARNVEGVKIFDIEVDINDSDDRLKPGMTANIEIQGAHKEDVLTVPIEAAFRQNGDYVVYVFDGSEDEPVERVVETGINSIGSLEIITGLEEGEIVALYNPEIEGDEMSEDERRRQRMSQRAGGRH